MSRCQQITFAEPCTTAPVPVPVGVPVSMVSYVLRLPSHDTESSHAPKVLQASASTASKLPSMEVSTTLCRRMTSMVDRRWLTR